MPDMTQDEFDERIYAAIQRALSISPSGLSEEELLEKLARGRPIVLPDPGDEELSNI